MNKIFIKEMFTVVFSYGSTSKQVPQTIISEPTKAEITRDPIAEALIAEAPIAEAPIALKRQITVSRRSKIRSLSNIALWPFRRIAASVDLPLSTVFSICAWSGSPHQICTGRLPCLSHENKCLLPAHATPWPVNRRKSLDTISKELDIHVHERTLRPIFSDSGYHRRIARVKPFLIPKQKMAQLLFVDIYID